LRLEDATLRIDERNAHAVEHKARPQLVRGQYLSSEDVIGLWLAECCIVERSAEAAFRRSA
jgi:hypothetical protein